MRLISQSFILCAGKATRLYPLTLDRPKCLLPIGTRNVLQIIIQYLESYGISKHICNAYWQKHLIKEFVTNYNKNIFISDEESILGTFGGIVHALPYLEEQFVVVYGDTITNFNLSKLFDFHKKNKSDITILSGRTQTPRAGGLIFADNMGRVERIIEKPEEKECVSNLINAGIIVVNKKAVEKYTDHGFFDIGKNWLPTCINDKLSVFHLEIEKDDYFIDMGTFENYNKLQDLLNVNYENTIKN